jgi:hypothetical protein
MRASHAGFIPSLLLSNLELAPAQFRNAKAEDSGFPCLWRIQRSSRSRSLENNCPVNALERLAGTRVDQLLDTLRDLFC